MSKQKFFATLIISTLTLLFCVAAATAQRPDNQPNTDPLGKPKNVKTEPDDVFKRWLNEDVSILITPAERAAFLKLKTNEERENFIQTFWDRRDPNPDTEENEYRDAYYERLAYANEHFSSGIPGWKTDRGRIYITWGKPDEIESHPSGGGYEKPSYEGGGSATTFPFETWFYRHLDGVGDGVEIQFVDQTGSGEYRIARDFNEKYITLGPQQPADTNASYIREQDMPFNRQDIIRGLETPPKVKFDDLNRIITDSPVIEKNPLAFDLRIDFFQQAEGRDIASFTIQTNNKDLQFDPVGGLQTATLNIFGRVTAVSGKRSGIFEDVVTTNATNEELLKVKNAQSVYQRSVALTPGTYKVSVIVRDVGTGNKGIVDMGFTVPKYDPAKLSTSSLILASNLRATNRGDIGNRFVIGNTKLIPNVSGVYKQGQPVGVYLQVYNAGIDETTLRPNVDVEYIVMKDGGQVSSVKEDWSGLSDSGERLTLARLLPTDGLKPGAYEVRVVTKDRVGEKPRVIENKAAFTITK